MKVLTIAVPAYNVERYLDKCLSSMAGQDPRLEIIVVNDGSTDGTERIARRYVQQYPDEVRLVCKENGGHGSAINEAARAAAGRYFKVVDADDWILTESLPKVLDALEASTADAVVMGYQTVNMASGRTVVYRSECACAGREVGLDDLLEVYWGISSCCSFHGLCYRTEMYRGSGLTLTEGVYYEDHEYATLPFAYVKTVLILPVCLYVYQIGNAEQSVSFQNQVKRRGDIERVIRRMIAFRQQQGGSPAAWHEYFMRKLSVIVVSYFVIALIKNPDRETGRGDAERFEAYLREELPEVLERTRKKRQMLRLMGRLHVSPKLYHGLIDTRLYKTFRALWIN